MLIYHKKSHIVILLEHNVLRGGCAQSLMTLRIALCHMFSRAFMSNILFHDVDCHINHCIAIHSHNDYKDGCLVCQMKKVWSVGEEKPGPILPRPVT